MASFKRIYIFINQKRTKKRWEKIQQNSEIGYAHKRHKETHWMQLFDFNA